MVSKGYPETKGPYTELADRLSETFSVRTIEVLNTIGEYSNIRSNEIAVKQNLEYFLIPQ